MKTIIKRLSICLTAVLTFGAAFLLLVQPSVGQVEEEFTNLQFFPVDIDRDRLIDIMRNWEAELGVDCGHCHVAYGRDDPRNDFVSDDKQPKLVARLMLDNLIAFNRTLTTEALAKPVDEIERVQCSTCHQGNAIPPVYEIPEE